MRHFLVLALVVVPLAATITCPLTGYTLDNTGLRIFNTTSKGYKTCTSYCTKNTFTNTTYTQSGLIGASTLFGSGVIYTCDDDTYFKGRFTAYPGLVIESCYWDNCTDAADLDKKIECGYAPEGWNLNNLANVLPTPTNTLLCKTNTCFKLSATREGRFVVGNNIITYKAGNYYDCGDKYCSGTLYAGEDNTAQFTCCNGNRCNLGEQPVKTNGASSLLSTSILISVLGVKLFA